MKNFVQRGDNLTLTAPYGLTSGQGALVGAIFGVASADAAINTDVVLVTEGVFDLTKAAGALTAGALVYWDNVNRNVTATATGNKLIGATTRAAASGDATARVLVTGQVS